MISCRCPALAGIAVVAWRYARRIPVRHVRAGMRAAAVAVLAVLLRQYRMWAAWRRLRPLWEVVSQAAPQVRLPSRAGTLLNARYRLHRRVIEIRDAELALRPYWDQRVAAEAVGAAASAGLPPETRDAIAEAAVIMTALAVRRQGLSAGGSIAAGSLISAPRNDLWSEAARLLLVADAIRSPVVRALANRPRAAGASG